LYWTIRTSSAPIAMLEKNAKENRNDLRIWSLLERY
jgi:hypothetical protein